MATLKDVARESGLTVGTVSRVLNNRGYISQKTRDKVYQVMQELNYQPNEMARSLSMQKSNTIGVIVPHISHPYFAKALHALEHTAYNYKYKVLLFNSMGKEEKEDEYLEMCKSNRVAGLILFSGTFHTEKFRNLDFPLVTVERSIERDFPSIECDNYLGGVLAAELLIGKGCTHLLHLATISGVNMPADKRRQGFEDICRRQGVSYQFIDLGHDFYEDLTYHPAIYDAMQKYPETDGVFASSDMIAAQTIQVCSLLDLPVPDRVKIVGFDDVNIASLTTPRITTIRQPIQEMVEAAVTMIVQAAEGKAIPARSIFPVTLIPRETT